MYRGRKATTVYLPRTSTATQLPVRNTWAQVDSQHWGPHQWKVGGVEGKNRGSNSCLGVLFSWLILGKLLSRWLLYSYVSKDFKKSTNLSHYRKGKCMTDLKDIRGLYVLCCQMPVKDSKHSEKPKAPPVWPWCWCHGFILIERGEKNTPPGSKKWLPYLMVFQKYVVKESQIISEVNDRNLHTGGNQSIIECTHRRSKKLNLNLCK